MGLGLAAWQWAVLGGGYAAFFVLPAFWMARRAKRDGDKVAVWTILVLLASVMGIIEYYEHRAVLKARARRGAEAPDYGASTRVTSSEPDPGEEAPPGATR